MLRCAGTSSLMGGDRKVAPVFSRPHLPTLDTGLLVRPLLYRKCHATHTRAGDDVAELSHIVRC